MTKSFSNRTQLHGVVSQWTSRWVSDILFLHSNVMVKYCEEWQNTEPMESANNFPTWFRSCDAVQIGFYVHLWPVGRPVPLTKFLALSSLVQELYGWAWQSNQCNCRYSFSSWNHFESCPPGCICFLSCSLSTKSATISLAISGTLGGDIVFVLPSQQQL